VWPGCVHLSTIIIVLFFLKQSYSHFHISPLFYICEHLFFRCFFPPSSAPLPSAETTDAESDGEKAVTSDDEQGVCVPFSHSFSFFFLSLYLVVSFSLLSLSLSLRLFLIAALFRAITLV